MKTVRRPPYPKWNPGYFPCSSLTPLPLSSRRPSVSFGGFGLRSGGRVQRGRSPLWWGLGEPREPVSAPLPAREVRMSGADTGALRRGVGAPLRIRDGAGPAGESREGRALFGGGLGNPRTRIRSASRQGSGRMSGAGTGALRLGVGRPYEFGTEPVRRESPERAEPSLVGAWGTPKPLSAPLPAREVGGPGVGTGALRLGVGRPHEFGTEPVRRESPERAEPSLVGAWGTPKPLSAPLPAREVGGPGVGTGAQPCAPTSSDRREDLNNKPVDRVWPR